MTTLKHIGEECMMIRRRSNLSQDDLAKQFNVTRETISRFEAGKSNNLKLFILYMSLEGAENG